jgi:hypothetical protein
MGSVSTLGDAARRECRIAEVRQGARGQSQCIACSRSGHRVELLEFVRVAVPEPSAH